MIYIQGSIFRFQHFYRKVPIHLSEVSVRNFKQNLVKFKQNITKFTVNEKKIKNIDRNYIIWGGGVGFRIEPFQNFEHVHIVF